MPQERCVPHAIAWRGHNPFQALPEYLIQSYPSLNAHTVGYGPFWGNGIPEHILMRMPVERPPFPATASAEGAQLNVSPSSAGTLVRVLEAPVKDGVNPVRMRSGFMSWSTGHGL